MYIGEKSGRRVKANYRAHQGKTGGRGGATQQ